MGQDQPFRTRVLGGLIGIAVGDALGVPVEGAPRSRLARHPVQDMIPATRWNLPAGTWSDDTSLTFCLVASLVELGRLDLADVARRFVRWLDEGYWSPYGFAVGIGRTTRQAIDRLRRGVPPEQAGGRGEWSNGNGSLMRILPVALYFASASETQMLEAAHAVSRITHGHPRSQMACGLYCLVARELLHGRQGREAVLRAMQSARQLYAEAPFSEEAHHFRRLLDGEIWQLAADEIRSSGYVVDTLEASIWSLCTSESFEEAVLKAVNLGGDTDTVGAVTGGLAGVRWGLDSIPGRWVQSLARSDEIMDLVTRFADRVGM